MSRSPKTERRGRRRYWTVSRALSVLLATSLLALGLVLTLLLSLRIGGLMDLQRQAHAGSQARAAASNLSRQLELHVRLLRDHAALPILSQGLMQPETQKPILADFMSGLSFLGTSAQEVLLDFRGARLAVSREAPEFDYLAEPWVEAILDGRLDSYRGISEAGGRFYWRLAVPVRYKGLTEGALVAEIPFGQLYGQMGLPSHLEGVRMELQHAGHVIWQLGTAAKGTVLELPGPVPDTRLRFHIDTGPALRVRNRMVLEIAGLVALMVALTATLSIRLGRHWFMEPVRDLQTVARSLAAGAECVPPDGRQRLKELDDLSHGFARMARRIGERERALIASRDDLAAANAQLRHSQKQLVQSEKMASLGTLAAGVAHEINNPIGFIQANLATLRDYHAVLLPLIADYRALVQARAEREPELLVRWERGVAGEDLDFLIQDLESLVSDTDEGARRVAEIVAGLGSFAHGGESRDEPLDLNDCVTAAVRLAGSALKYKAEVEQRLEPVPRLRGSPGQMTQVLVNLLVNAAQAIEESGHVRIETRQEGNGVLVSVTDDGSGIAPEHLSQLFTPFFTTKKVGVGTGLGLSISHGIVERHGGFIEVDSEPGRGTCMRVRLPLEREEPTSAEEALS